MSTLPADPEPGKKKAAVRESAGEEEVAPHLQLVAELVAADAYSPREILWRGLRRNAGFWLASSALLTGLLAMTAPVSHALFRGGDGYTILAMLALPLLAPLLLDPCLEQARDEAPLELGKSLRQAIPRLAGSFLLGFVHLVLPVWLVTQRWAWDLVLTVLTPWAAPLLPTLVLAGLGSWIFAASEWRLGGRTLPDASAAGVRLFLGSPGRALRGLGRILTRSPLAADPANELHRVLFVLLGWLPIYCIGTLAAFGAYSGVRALGLPHGAAEVGGFLAGTYGAVAAIQLALANWTTYYLAFLATRDEELSAELVPALEPAPDPRAELPAP